MVLGVVTAIDLLSYITTHERQDSSMSESSVFDNATPAVAPVWKFPVKEVDDRYALQEAAWAWS